VQYLAQIASAITKGQLIDFPSDPLQFPKEIDILLDANVLYCAPLRDLLLQLAFAGLFQARWSADIDDEWQRNLLAARPELASQIARTHAIMHRGIPDALVTGYQSRIAWT
jgi:hypothetical protein